MIFRGIPMCVWSVRQILARRKRMTRRIIAGPDAPCRYGVVGDRLYVREPLYDGPTAISDYGAAHYTADETTTDYPWVWQGERLPGLFMPKGCARIVVEITELRAERLQFISREDIGNEGICLAKTGPSAECGMLAYRDYQALWDSLNPKPPRNWASNPWVRVIEFKVLSMEQCETQRLLAA